MSSFYRYDLRQLTTSSMHIYSYSQVWINVSRSWGALESIFLASADIRSQLPDDTKRFEGLDSEFKEVLITLVTFVLKTY